MAWPASQPKKPTNVTILAELLAQAREIKLNRSRDFEAHPVEVIRMRRGEQWLHDNREAIEAYNCFVAENGVFSDGLRGS